MGNEIALPYVPIDPRIDKHPKTRKLLRLLGVADDPDAHMHVVRFLMAVGNLYPGGHLGSLDPEEIADMARWRGDATKFAAAMCDAGWLLIGVGGYVVVGWEDYGGRVHAKRVAFREKQSENRRKGWGKKAKPSGTTDDQNLPDSTKSIPNETKTSEGEGEVKGECKGEEKQLLTVRVENLWIGAVSTTSQVEQIASQEGWGIQLGPNEVKAARKALSRGPVPSDIVNAAITKTHDTAPDKPLLYFLGTVAGMLDDIAKGRGPPAGQSHLSRKGQDIAKALANSDPNMFVFDR